MKQFVFLILLFSSLRSYCQEKSHFFLNYTLNKTYSTDILDQFYKFINEPLDHEKGNYWVESAYFKNPVAEIQNIFNDAKNHKITILSIIKIDEKRSVIKIALIKANNNFGNLFAIYNFISDSSENKVRFENILDYNVKNFKVFIVDEIKYLTYQEYSFDKKNADKLVQFNKQMATFFEKEVISFTYFLCKDMNHFRMIRGFDFDDMMVSQNQIGAETFPSENLIFSGNNSEYYPHEVVHLYTHSYFPRTHQILDEGIATYFGGSKGLEFKEHISKLKNHLIKNDINIYEKLFKESQHYVLDDTTSLWYTIGALLCDIALNKYGKETLLSLMNSGKKDEDLLLAIEEKLNIKRENLDTFIKKQLLDYQ
ncbi:hypothetical protein [Flavobacterium sp. XS2P14]|uniref:hypothetical protein n=1 Tax=Flavobacterium sp. XS2P14 TaxID=3401735 RepID=UPI003AADAAB2